MARVMWAAFAATTFLAGIDVSGIELSPCSLPSAEPAGPGLWFAPGDEPALAARKADPGFAGYYGEFKAYADGRLAALAGSPQSLDDDTLSKTAKAAAMLHVVGDLPSCCFPTYAHAAVAALGAIRSRSPWRLLPPADAVDVLQDSSRLQSMVEAYDMLRGTGAASPAQDAAIRSRMAQWANALRNDVNLTGLVFPPIEGHRDNWGIKGGSALVSAALAMPAAADAPSWLAFGLELLNESLAIAASDTGWYREGPHYLNYSLNNLVSTAYHVRNAAGVDWFGALAPFVAASLDMRQPDGRMAPFEEGVTIVFPFDVLAGAYPELAPAMTWAWQQSPMAPGNYDNQQIHSVTRFLAAAPWVAPAEPAGGATRFIEGDAHIHVLRSGLDAAALQATMITAVDKDDSTLIESRHHVQNPLDLTLHALGKLLLPTASGGPEVTKSQNRSVYLRPDCRNIPLVDGTAPFVMEAASIASTGRVDSRDAGRLANHFADMAATAVASYAGARSVRRTVVMIDEGYVVVADELDAPAARDFAVVYRGRGTRVLLSDTPSLSEASWEYQGLAIDLHAAASAAVALMDAPSLYAAGWGQEETIESVQVTARGDRVRVLAVLSPRAAGDPALTAAALDLPGGAAALELRGALVKDFIVLGEPGTSRASGPVTTDARLAVVRERDGAVEAFVVADGKVLEYDGETVFSADAPMTLALTFNPGGLLAEISRDDKTPTPFRVARGSGLPAGAPLTARLDGRDLSAAEFRDDDSFSFSGFAGGGTLSVREASRTYYVSTAGNDANAGTLAEPWRTVQHAADTALGGDAVYVRGGVYNERVVFPCSGSVADGEIAFRSYPGEQPVLDGTGLAVPADQPGMLVIANRSFLTIEGFEIRNYKSTVPDRVPIGIHVLGASSHIEIRGNRVHHIETHAPLDGNLAGADAHGIAVYGTSAADSIHDIVIEGNELHDLILGSSEALALNGNVERFTVSRNTIHHCDNIGIDCIGFEGTCPNALLDQARDGLIAENDVYAIDTVSNPSYGGERAAAAIYVDGGARIVIERNRAHHSNFGMELASEHAEKATSRVTVRSNFIYANQVAGLAMGGYDAARGSTVDCAVLNNTFFDNDTDEQGNGEILLQYDVRGTAIENNIFYPRNAQSLLVGNPFTQNTGLTVDYNVYFAPAGIGQSEWQWKNAVYQGFAAYRAATGNDAHSFFVDPRLADLNAPDLHLQQDSPAIDKAATLADIGSADVDGNPRSIGPAPDAGADEFRSLPHNMYLPFVAGP